MRRPDQEVPIVAECVPNIGVRGMRRRRIVGAGWVLVTLAVFAVIARQQAATAAFLLVAPFVGMAAVNFFQVKEKT